jgi:hypothetical protein
MTSHDAAPAKKKTMPRWLGVLVGFMLAVAGGAKLLGAMTLPGCDSSETAQIVREIFKEKTGETVEVSEAKQVSETSADKSCAAHIATATETAEITYRVFWDGWSKMVQIGEVKAQPIKNAPQS